MPRLRISSLLPIFAAILMLASCSSQRSALRKAASSAIPADIASQSPEQRFTKLCESYADWQDVSLSLRAEVKGLSCSGKAVMRRGQWVSISLRMLGFEVASLWIDRDSVHAVDRYHKMYLSESIAKVLDTSDVTIADVQDLLMGRAFLAGTAGGTLTTPLLPAFTLTPSEHGLMIVPRTQPAGVEYGFILNDDSNSVLATSVGVDGKYPVTVSYADYVATRFAGTFASVVAVDFPARKLSGTITWDFGSAKWNTAETRSWSAPRNYRRISGSQLLQSVSSF